MTTPEEKTIPKKAGRGPAKNLTGAQKAEAVALWRAGEITLEGLSKKFKKRPETFSRMFTRMGITKGSGAAAALKKAEELVAERVVSDTELTLQRIAEVRESHFTMSRHLAKLAFREIINAKNAELDVGKLKDVMTVYKMASDVVANSRKELFDLLNVEKHEQADEIDNLPDLTVRELTTNEIEQLHASPMDGDDDEDDLGADMLDLDEDNE